LNKYISHFRLLWC